MAFPSTGEELGNQAFKAEQQVQQRESPYTPFKSNEGESERERGMAYSSTGEELGNQGFKAEQQVQQQESPYTHFKSNEDYVRAGYGAEGYEPAVPAEDHQPDYYSPSAPAPVAAHSRDGGDLPASHEGGGMKEKLKEKVLGPCLGHQPASHHQEGHH